MPKRRCLDCPRYTRSGSRCPECEYNRLSRINNKNRQLRNANRKAARALIAASPVCACTRRCPWHLGHPCEATEDLTADHIVAIANGGTNNQRQQVLCRRCNSSKGRQ